MDLIPVASEVVKSILGWLPSACLRWYYKPERLARLVYVDLLPRQEAVYLNLAPAADFRITLQIINLSPFPIELDRSTVRLSCGTSPLQANNLERHQFKAGEVGTVQFSNIIPESHASQILTNDGGGSAALDGVLEFNCHVQSFKRVIPYLNGIPITIVNAQLRK
jgi:hypothetical protein